MESQVLNKIQASMQGSRKPSMHNQTCMVCKSIIGYDATYRLYECDTICSSDCHDRYKSFLDKKYYDTHITGIPLKYRSIEADKKMVADNYGHNLFVTGSSGSGKTVLASGIAKECFRNRKPVRWINYSQFIMDLQSMYSRKNESPFDEAEKVANFDGLLIIDDLGAEKMTDWVRQITYYIINEREQRLLPMLITSNFSLEQIAEQIDVRISSRIAGVCKSIKLMNKDRRLEDRDKSWKDGEAKSIYLDKWKKP